MKNKGLQDEYEEQKDCRMNMKDEGLQDKHER